MGSPPDVVELPVIDGIGVMTLEQIRDALEGNAPYDDVLISSMCAHLNAYQEGMYGAWESAMGEDL